MQPEGLEHWSRLKGIDVVGTGDFVHPQYFKQLRAELVEAEPGLYRLKRSPSSPVRFLLSVELSHIYKHGEKTRKVHHLVLAPHFEAAKKLGAALAARGRVDADGRPIFGIHSHDLLKLLLDTDPACALIPAHAWTPWFSVFGSKSGYDSLEECFGEDAKHIFAIETGLSSDRPMNRRLSALDHLTLVSNSDAHSPSKLGREANVLQCELSYAGILGALNDGSAHQFPYTIEFFPEEGKYHYDGHRDCRVCLHPRETKERQGRCPSCGKPLTLGVMHRIEALADRPWDYAHPGEEGRQRSIIPLEELIADAFDCGAATKRVRERYLKMMAELGSEFVALLDADHASLTKASDERLADAVLRVRRGEVTLSPGYDGEFGKIAIYRELRKSFSIDGIVQMKLL